MSHLPDHYLDLGKCVAPEEERLLSAVSPDPKDVKSPDGTDNISTGNVKSLDGTDVVPSQNVKSNGIDFIAGPNIKSDHSVKYPDEKTSEFQFSDSDSEYQKLDVGKLNKEKKVPLRASRSISNHHKRFKISASQVQNK